MRGSREGEGPGVAPAINKLPPAIAKFRGSEFYQIRAVFLIDPLCASRTRVFSYFPLIENPHLATLSSG